MFVLTKFWQNKSFRDLFIEGHLHLSGMTEYTKIVEGRKLHERAKLGDAVAAEELKRAYGDQTDIFEGTIGSIDIGEANVKDEKLGQLIADPKLRAKGYDYSNVMCFCKINYKVTGHVGPPRKGTTIINLEEPDMKQYFGDYGVIIKNQNALYERIAKTLDEYGFHYLFGSVRYHPLELNGRKLESCFKTYHMQRCDLVLINEFPVKPRRLDAFDKWEKHSYENEYRLVVNRYPNGKTYDNYTCDAINIDIGDLSDIVEPIESSELVDCIYHLLNKREIVPSIDGFMGNVSRRTLRDEFIDLSDGMAYEILSFGKNAVYYTEE